MPKIVSLALIVLLISSFIGLKYSKYLNFLNFLILGLTLVVLIWYTYDTHRMADQTIESNLRPVILRSSFVLGWNTIQFRVNENNVILGDPLQFTVLKNIAKDISGYIVIDNQKRPLWFGSSQISPILIASDTANTPSQQGTSYSLSWGWLAPGNVVQAIYDPRLNPATTTEENKIYIEYKDITNNEYYTLENKNFSQTPGKF